jgi:hypothetical protein
MTPEVEALYAIATGLEEQAKALYSVARALDEIGARMTEALGVTGERIAEALITSNRDG